MKSSFDYEVNVLASSIIKNFPVVKVSNGKASIQYQSPYEVKGPEGKVVVIIDTSG